jgi:Ca-activated chloride channel family protein
MKKARNKRKVLLTVSDGGDNHSRYAITEISSVVREADVQIYALGIFDNAPKRNFAISTRLPIVAPNLAHDGKWHKISVRLRPPQSSLRLRVYASAGYYAPAR